MHSSIATKGRTLNGFGSIALLIFLDDAARLQDRQLVCVSGRGHLNSTGIVRAKLGVKVCGRRILGYRALEFVQQILMLLGKSVSLFAGKIPRVRKTKWAKD